MLTASPNSSSGTKPNSFMYSPRAEQSAPSLSSSYHKSPSFSGFSSGRSSNRAGTTSSTSAAHPASRANYQNVSTQYSPMNETRDIDTSRLPLLEKKDATHAIPISRVRGISDEATTHSSIEQNGSQLSVKSPTMKRRQASESAGPGSPSVGREESSLKKSKSSTREPKVLPLRYEFCDVEDMVILIADMISELIETNDNLPLRDVVLTRFHSRTAPGISVIDYLQRLAKHAALTPPLLLSMVYYIDRLCSLYPAFTITTLTVHRFLITAATVAAKGLSDSFWNNTTYARVGGIKLAELGMLELEFLYRVDWRIVPNPEVLVDYYRGLVSRADGYVLEDDLSEKISSDGSEQELEGSDAVGDINSPEHDITGAKWELWMKDVADNSGSKMDGGTLGSSNHGKPQHQGSPA